MTPQETVDSFARLTARCLDALIAEYAGQERPTVWTAVWLRPRDGSDPVRAGLLDGLGTFKLHGVGCQFELDSGESLDVDWDFDGRAVFDSFRILMFARSVGDDSVNQEALRTAAVSDLSILQLAEDRFTWTHRNYDVSRLSS